MSSSQPGASPTNITRACGLPSANTSCVAVTRSAQPSKRSRMARRSSRLAALGPPRARPSTAASGEGGAARRPRAVPARARHGASAAKRDGSAARSAPPLDLRRPAGRSRRTGSSGDGIVREPVHRLLADDRVDARLRVEGEQFAGGFVCGRRSSAGFSIGRSRNCRPLANVENSSQAAPSDAAGTLAGERHGRRAARPRGMEFDVVIVGAGPAGPVGGDPAEAARARPLRRRGREGLGGRRPYPVGRGDRSGRPRPAAARLARRGHAAQDAGDRRPLLLARARPARCACPTS